MSKIVIYLLVLQCDNMPSYMLLLLIRFLLNFNIACYFFFLSYTLFLPIDVAIHKLCILVEMFAEF